MAGNVFPCKAAYVACRGNASGACAYGCTGCGKCVGTCPFQAITLREGHAAVIDSNTCRACGLCVKACSRGIIRLHEAGNKIVVACSNRSSAKETRDVCQTGCIGCGLCERICTASAVRVKDNLAVLDESPCLVCGMCAVRCPRSAISDLTGILTRR